MVVAYEPIYGVVLPKELGYALSASDEIEVVWIPPQRMGIQPALWATFVSLPPCYPWLS